jgi:hypothetical protein
MRLNVYIMCLYADALDVYHNARKKGGWNSVSIRERQSIRQKARENGWEATYDT